MAVLPLAQGHFPFHVSFTHSLLDPDDDDFEPAEATPKAPAVVSDKWDGEDEEDDVKDTWDKSSGDEDGDADKPKAIQRKKKKKLADIIAEKEAAKEAELERKAGEAAAKKQMNTPEGKLAEKLRLQKMEENSNLMLAKDMMGELSIKVKFVLVG